MNAVDQADGATTETTLTQEPELQTGQAKAVLAHLLTLAWRITRWPESGMSHQTQRAVAELATVPAAPRVEFGCCPGGVRRYRQSRVYIAGPMRGYPADNAAAFFRAHYAWQAAGWEVINPVLMDLEKPLATKADIPTDDGVATGSSWAWRQLWLRDMQEIILRADAICFLVGHHKSAGAEAEWHLGNVLNLPLYYQNEDGSWR